MQMETKRKLGYQYLVKIEFKTKAVELSQPTPEGFGEALGGSMSTGGQRGCMSAPGSGGKPGLPLDGAFPRHGGGGGDAALLLPLPRVLLQLHQPKPTATLGRRGGGSRHLLQLPAACLDAVSPQHAPVAGPGLHMGR